MRKVPHRLLSVLLLTAMLVGLFPTNIFAQLTAAEEISFGTAATRAAAANAVADPVEIVLDYAKAVEIPTASSAIRDKIETDANTTLVGLAGISASGTHGDIVSSVSNLACSSAGDTFAANYGTFTRITSGLTYQPTKFMANLEKVYLVYKIRVSGVDKYLYVELRLVPAPSMYYETDFSASAFERYSTDGLYYFDTDNSFYADFTNTELDQERYKKNLYNGTNYDLETNWNALPKDPDTLIDAYTTPIIENGELKVNYKADDATRTWIWVQANGDLNEGFDLKYHPHESYVVQVRVKFHDLMAANGTPYMNLYYFTGVDRWDGNADDFGDRTKEKLYRLKKAYSFTAEETAALDTNEYIIITFPMGETASEAHTLMTNLRFQFGNVRSKSSTALGGFTFDYVFVGPETSAPSRSASYKEQTHLQDALFFDFAATPEDLNHYGTHNYLSQNFDDASAWGSTTPARIESVSLDKENSALVYTSKVLADTVAPNFTIYTPKDLRYTPANAEVFQIRFKLENYKRGEYNTDNGTSQPPNQLTLSYWTFGATAWADATNATQFSETHLNSGEYVTIQMDLKDNFKQAIDVTTLRLQITGLESISAAELGKMTIDYIYIGPRATAPTTIKDNDYLLFDFKNSEADRNRYANDPAYGTKKL